MVTKRRNQRDPCAVTSTSAACHLVTRRTSVTVHLAAFNLLFGLACVCDQAAGTEPNRTNEQTNSGRRYSRHCTRSFVANFCARSDHDKARQLGPGVLPPAQERIQQS